MTDRLAALTAQGVSLWLDDLSRQRLHSGNLKDLIDTWHISGVTTNPSIFQTALKDTACYQKQLDELAARGATVDDTVREITTDDVRDATDLFGAVYTRTRGSDGRVSIEVDPRLAHDTAATIDQAKELFKIVDRNNVLIKIPATLAGLPAITAVIAEGISVNVTLIFSGPIPGRDGRLHRRTGAGQGSRPRPLPDPLCRFILCVPARFGD